MSTSSCVSLPPRLRYPVKTSTWVTRCSGSAHRSDGSPEAFIVLQVYCDCPGSAPPIRLPRGRPPHFPSRLFAWLPSYRPRERSLRTHTCQFEKMRDLKNPRLIPPFRESIPASFFLIISCKKTLFSLLSTHLVRSDLWYVLARFTHSLLEPWTLENYEKQTWHRSSRARVPHKL